MCLKTLLNELNALTLRDSIYKQEYDIIVKDNLYFNCTSIFFRSSRNLAYPPLLKTDLRPSPHTRRFLFI
jgi:hypothetical protein